MKKVITISDKLILKLIKKGTFGIRELMRYGSLTCEDAFKIMKHLVKNRAIRDNGDGSFSLLIDKDALTEVMSGNGFSVEKTIQEPSRKKKPEKVEEEPEEIEEIFAKIRQIKERATYSEGPSLALDYVYLVNESSNCLKVPFNLSDTPVTLVNRMLVNESKDSIAEVWDNIIPSLDDILAGREKLIDRIECFRLSIKLSFFDEEFSDDISLDVNLAEYLLASAYFYEGDRPRFLVRFK